MAKLAPRILPFAEPIWERLDEARRAGRRILFEGAQAVMLDVDHGTYPFVTSSNTVAATAAAGAGVGPAAVGFVLGIAKAYSTRVGAGPFPTELPDETGQLLGDRGNEFGTVTGRRRRCGWFDAALVRQAVKVGGINGLALTKLDVLDGLPELRMYGLPYPRYALTGTFRRRPVHKLRLQYGGGRGMDWLDPGRAFLGPIAGPGRQIRAADRGVGGSPGDAALHQSRTRRYDSHARPVRGLKLQP